MDIFLVTLSLVIGLIVGSFLNVVIFRLRTGRTLIKGRSACMCCGATLHPHELIPVLSFVLQRGRCRACGARISWQYPFVELLTGVLFATLFFFVYPLGGIWDSAGLLLLLVIGSLSIILTVYDMRHTILPDVLVYALLIATLGYIGVAERSVVSVASALRDGILVAAPLILLWVVSRGRWIGLGDGKLALFTGALLGVVYGFSALILAFWIGALYALAVLFLRQRKLTMKSEIAFGPFLILATFLVFVFHINVFTLLIFS